MFNIKQPDEAHVSANGSASLEIWLRSVLCFQTKVAVCYFAESTGSRVHVGFGMSRTVFIDRSRCHASSRCLEAYSSPAQDKRNQMQAVPRVFVQFSPRAAALICASARTSRTRLYKWSIFNPSCDPRMTNTVRVVRVQWAKCLTTTVRRE